MEERECACEFPLRDSSGVDDFTDGTGFECGACHGTVSTFGVGRPNRLTAEDITEMRFRVLDGMGRWRSSAGGAWTPGPSDVDALRRLAMHAIGCTYHDLRPVELATVRHIVDEVTEPAAPAAPARMLTRVLGGML